MRPGRARAGAAGMNALWSPGSDDPRPPGPAPPAGSLAGRQAALVAALVAGGPDPAGIPTHLLTATRTALLRKRAGAAAAAWPLLAAGIGPEWPRVFADRFAGVPPYGAEREGWDLARELDAAGALGPGASRELADREHTFRYDGRTAPSRRSAVSRGFHRWWRGGPSHL
ncbi:hypothetical protein Ae168Ps1_2382 [Pseudonocardia sp. Ae168_Ps1]|nr:hypothetical protein Ae150APs1_2377 [Pseudonocardia sp. Ae150A_Ps1]OLL79976.1 hypothetical protein Ae168Ps1_2382 [Pseudonocardia sp. Ae168_Ps1]OLL85890.1 hypothetical protein Ae263Ps1_2945c [Pseudonocardia sp. Ae263_Ps1]OLL94079.1 hypothetical protein Ae356Ps1_3976 [Pseudonocardia sp. Ae356_Ps1]